MLNLCRIFQDERSCLDTYLEAVVVAETMEDAQKIHPSGDNKDWGYQFGTWCESPESVHVEFLARLPMDSELEAGDVIIASFYGV